MPDPLRYSRAVPWVMLGCIWLINLVICILLQCVSPLLPVLIDQFEVSHSAGGFLYAIPIMMVALLSYPLGVLSDRIGAAKALSWGATVAVLASFLRPLAPDFIFLVAFTAIYGFGFSLYFPNLAKTVKEQFPAHFVGTATGIYTTAIPLGAGVGIALTKPLLAATGSWQKVMVVWSIVALVILAICAIAVIRCRGASRGSFPPAPTSSEDGAKPTTALDPFQGGHPAQRGRDRLPLPVFICGLLLAILNVIFYATLGWLPTYLTEEGWSLASAAAVTSIISFMEVPAVLLVPILSDRTGRRKLIILTCFFLIALSTALVAVAPSYSWAVAPVLGITFGAPFALLLAFPAQFSRHEKVGSAAGMVLSIGYAGALLGPPLAGYVRDLTGAFSIGFMGTAGAALLAAILTFGLPDGAGGGGS